MPIKKQKGGTLPNDNIHWCDGNNSQCMDIYTQTGGNTYYYKYKKYYKKYKNLVKN